MTWVCHKCGRQHDTPEVIAQCNKRERSLRRWGLAIMGAILFMLLGAELVWNQYAYGDWRCTFMHCVKVTK